MSESWYIIYAIDGPRSLLNVQEAFNRANIRVILWRPSYKRKVLEDGEFVIKEYKMFFNYIFACFDSEPYAVEQILMELKTGWFLKAPGNNCPCKISEEDIVVIRNNETKLSETRDNSIVFKIGDYVEIRTGSFIGFKGQIVDINNHDVLIELFIFGRTSIAKVSLDNIKQMDSSQILKEKL